MGCITKHYLNESTILGVWKIEEDIDTLLGMIELDIEDRKRLRVLQVHPENLNF